VIFVILVASRPLEIGAAAREIQEKLAIIVPISRVFPRFFQATMAFFLLIIAKNR